MRAAVLLAGLMLATPVLTSQAWAADPVEAVRAAERRWLDAYEQHDPVAMEAALAQGYVLVDSAGRRIDRAATLAQVSGKTGPKVRFCTKETQARSSGDTVVLDGVVIMEMGGPNGVRRQAHRYMDTWVRQEGTWRVLSSQLVGPITTALACDPAP